MEESLGKILEELYVHSTIDDKKLRYFHNAKKNFIKLEKLTATVLSEIDKICDGKMDKKHIEFSKSREDIIMRNDREISDLIRYNTDYLGIHVPLQMQNYIVDIEKRQNMMYDELNKTEKNEINKIFEEYESIKKTFVNEITNRTLKQRQIIDDMMHDYDFESNISNSIIERILTILIK